MTWWAGNCKNAICLHKIYVCARVEDKFCGSLGACHIADVFRRFSSLGYIWVSFLKRQVAIPCTAHPEERDSVRQASLDFRGKYIVHLGVLFQLIYQATHKTTIWLLVRFGKWGAQKGDWKEGRRRCEVMNSSGFLPTRCLGLTGLLGKDNCLLISASSGCL